MALLDMISSQSWPLYVSVSAEGWRNLVSSHPQLPQVALSSDVQPAQCVTTPSFHANQQVLEAHKGKPTNPLENLPPDLVLSHSGWCSIQV